MCEEITHLHLDIELLNPTLLSANIQPVLYTSTKSMFLWFREQDVVQDSPKYFAQVQVNDIGRSCLIPASTVIQPRKAPPFVGHGVPSVTFQQTPPYFSFSGGSPPERETDWPALGFGTGDQMDALNLDVPLSPPPQGLIPQPQNYSLTLYRLRRDSSFRSSLWYIFASYDRMLRRLTSQLIKGAYM